MTHTAESVLAEFDGEHLRAMISSYDGSRYDWIQKANGSLEDLAQALADARNALMLDEAKLEAAARVLHGDAPRDRWADVGEDREWYMDQACAALLAAGMQERAT